jgi:calcium/calmodulin-dependent protein kinase I
VKVVAKSRLTQEDEIALQGEISILREMDHDNILKLFDVFEDIEDLGHVYYLVMEIMEGGDVFDRFAAKITYSEKEARDVCRVLFDALDYCHSRNIVHRDLKPENLLLVSRNSDLDVKIGDFGFAKRTPSESGGLKTQCGTPMYVAPEILRCVPYGTEIDMWSMGVIVYILLGGYAPFRDNDKRILFERIKQGQFTFHPEYWDHISDEAKGMVSELLEVDPQRRLTAADALNSPWMNQVQSLDLTQTLPQFRKFNAKRRLRQAVFTLMATNKMTSLGYMFRTTLSETSMKT